MILVAAPAKHVFCRDKTFVVTNTFAAANICRDKSKRNFVATSTLLSLTVTIQQSTSVRTLKIPNTSSHTLVWNFIRKYCTH